MVAISKNDKRFLVQSMPETVDLTQDHLQIFDSYIGEEGLHLRKEREPHTDERRCFLMRTVCGIPQEEFPISMAEYPHFSAFRERELRFNRYVSEGLVYETFLGDLRGVVICYSSAQEPDLIVKDITNDEYFSGPNMQVLSVADIRSRLGQ